MREENSDMNEGVVGLGTQDIRGSSGVNKDHTERKREEMCCLH